MDSATFSQTDIQSFIHSQLRVQLPVPTHDFTGQTIIVTGANTGLGLEAARYYVRLGAARVVLAVRSLDKGEAARADIEASTGRSGVVEVRHIDLSSYASVKKFAAEAADLPRIDALLANAGMLMAEWAMAEENESTLTVNVVSTLLLTILLLPALRRSAEKFNIVPIVAIVSSGTHAFVASATAFPQATADDIFAALNTEQGADMRNRYPLSKLICLLLARELARELAQKMKTEPLVVVNSVAPGLCHSGLTRNLTGDLAKEMDERKAKSARTTEQGSRTLVHATIAGPESHGRYLADCEIENKSLSPWVTGPEGQQAQEKLWRELTAKLEKIQPGIMQLV